MKNYDDLEKIDVTSFDSLIEGFQLISFERKYVYVNRAVVVQSKYKSKADLLGFTMMEKYPGIENTPMFKALEECMTKRVNAHFENTFKFPDGSIGWFELRVSPVPRGIFMLSMDISSRKKDRRKQSELH